MLDFGFDYDTVGRFGYPTLIALCDRLAKRAEGGRATSTPDSRVHSQADPADIVKAFRQK